MRARPDGLGERDVRLALAEGWRMDAAAMRYAAVGGGSYHWIVRDGEGRRWFVTVDDLDDKAWLGSTRPAVMTGLRSAMDTALMLRRAAGLEFVVAPVPGCDGTAVRPVGPRHAVAVFAFLSGTPGRWGEAVSAPERSALVDTLAALHRATPAVADGAPVAAIDLPRREALDAALRDLGQPWRTGPFAEPARAVLAGAEHQVRRSGRTGLLPVALGAGRHLDFRVRVARRAPPYRGHRARLAGPEGRRGRRYAGRGVIGAGSCPAASRRQARISISAISVVSAALARLRGVWHSAW